MTTKKKGKNRSGMCVHAAGAISSLQPEIARRASSVFARFGLFFHLWLVVFCGRGKLFVEDFDGVSAGERGVFGGKDIAD